MSDYQNRLECAMAAIHPEVLWAQRSSAEDATRNVVFLTVNVPDIHEDTLKCTLTPTSMSFSAVAGATGTPEQSYEFGLEFFAEIDPENSTRKLTSRSLSLILRKREAKLEYWPRLTKEKARSQHIKTDFRWWVDEDEQDDAPAFDADDFSGMVVE
ncbi:hypothetical protein B4N89_47105 [Embleya scabrispora]|uniref:CS domain-containing protein n=1 Tax=Embleya scabrispora TaxID=159449 RepID=A0A1T3NI66_9ACTN|nr:p23/wos2 family protein [Embleya scabrispora]OPC76576.1 hypothetical protein B4N89_47105 [Embleya scabrispora]